MLWCILYMFSSNFLGGGGSIRLDFVMVINNQNDDGCVPVPKIGTCTYGNLSAIALYIFHYI